jgi:uncharacterized protein YndB with AHSA1/START domain
MRTRAQDQGFVGAPPDVVYRAVADTRSYASWWADAGESSDGRVPLRLEPRRVTKAGAEQHRQAIGLFLRLGSPYDGTVEWYLEPLEDGTMVNVFLDVNLGRSATRRLRRIRTSIRRALVGLKKELE